MKTFILITILLVLAGCQASGGGAAGGGIISGHTEVAKEFTLTTTLNTTYSTGQVISFNLNFPVDVVVTGTPRIALTLGATTRYANFVSVSGADLTFTYTVVGGDSDSDGISASSTLDLNGGTIKFNTTEDSGTAISVPSLSTVKVNVVGGNAPVASNITPSSFNEDTSKTITLSYTDADGDLASSCALSGLTKVFISTPCACAAGTCTVGVTGSLNQNGAAGFSYTVTANGQTSNSATATFSITPVADAPIANNITPAAFNEDTQSVITLSYSDGDGDLAISCAISAPTNVTVTQACNCAAGVCTVGVTGTSNYSGAASFNYTVTANSQTSNSATASLTITSVNDAPVANNITPAAFNEDTQSVITLSYTDADSDLATTCAISSPTNVSVTQACACAAGVCTVGVTGTSNYNGAASFAYTVTANGQTSNSATATLSINAVDDAPVASNITPAAFAKNTQSVITLSYTDVESHLATSCSVSGLTNVTETQACACAAGVCTVGVTGTLNYTGAASFSYTVTANALTSNSATATLSITGGTAPVASNITPAAFNEDTQSVITLSYTDADADLATVCTISNLSNVTVSQACACAAGTCTVGVTGTNNYNGGASFDYTVTAAGDVSNAATATLTITAVDDAPVASDITPASFGKNTESVITLSYTDVESDQATACAIMSPTNVTVTTACSCSAGICTVGVTGTLNYTGAASFDYTVTANAAMSNTATATLSITSTPPVASNITPAAFNEDTQSIITLSYTDADGDLGVSCATSALSNVTVTQACACAAGTCTVGVTGTANYNGAASFNYTVTTDSVSNSASATLSISAVDDAPVASNITPASFNKNTESIISLSYTDVESDLATTCSVSNLSNVTVTTACACAAGICTVGVTGTSNYTGAASFDYTVTANSATSNAATASLTITSAPPVANNITPAAFNEDVQSVISLSYTDADGDSATSCAISSPTNVTVTQACACAAGACTVGVTGTSNYNGAASFSYTVTADGASNSATATLSITAVDDAPVASNITPADLTKNTQSVITLSYTDVESDLAASCSISNLSNVTVTQACACAAGTCTVGVTGTSNYTGAAGFDYTVTANSATSNTASATLNIISNPPVTSNITPAAFNEDVQSVITLSYTDADGDQATSCSASSLNNVTVTQACACAAGTCTIGVTGTTNYNGAASFDYTVTADGTSNAATATLTINPVDDAPVANNLTPAAFNEDTQSIITLSYTDVEGDFASSCAISSLTNVTVTQACSCTLGTCTVGVTGTSNYSGVASFTYTVTANSQTSNSATASLTISSVLDAPTTATLNPAAFNEDTQSVITLSYTNNGDAAVSCTTSALTNVTVTQACACAAGTCTVGVTGTSNYNGAASFQFYVSAGAGADSNTSTANLTINPVDDAAALGAISTQSTNRNVATSAIAFTFTDPDGAVCSAARLSMTSSNTSVVANGSVAWAGTAPNCTAVITPVSNAIGSTTITFTATDGGLANKTTAFTLNVTGAVLRWEYPISTVITSYSFGTPGGNTSVVLKLRNSGNATSGTISITDDAGSNKMDQSNNCTTLVANATCDVTVNWTNSGPGGYRQEIYTATATGTTADVTVSGTK